MAAHLSPLEPRAHLPCTVKIAPSCRHHVSSAHPRRIQLSSLLPGSCSIRACFYSATPNLVQTRQACCYALKQSEWLPLDSSSHIRDERDELSGAADSMAPAASGGTYDVAEPSRTPSEEHAIPSEPSQQLTVPDVDSSSKDYEDEGDAGDSSSREHGDEGDAGFESMADNDARALALAALEGLTRQQRLPRSDWAAVIRGAAACRKRHECLRLLQGLAAGGLDIPLRLLQLKPASSVCTNQASREVWEETERLLHWMMLQQGQGQGSMPQGMFLQGQRSMAAGMIQQEQGSIPPGMIQQRQGEQSMAAGTGQVLVSQDVRDGDPTAAGSRLERRRKAAQELVNSLLDLLWRFEKRKSALRLLLLSCSPSVQIYPLLASPTRFPRAFWTINAVCHYLAMPPVALFHACSASDSSEETPGVLPDFWSVDVRWLGAGGSLTALHWWLLSVQDLAMQGMDPPKDALIITGGNRKYTPQASNASLLLRRTLHYYLWSKSAPFFIADRGCDGLHSKGYSLLRWIKDSPHCLSLELEDSLHVPSHNSMLLFEGGMVAPDVAHLLQLLRNNDLPPGRPQIFSRLLRISDEKRFQWIRMQAETTEGRKERADKRAQLKKKNREKRQQRRMEKKEKFKK